ncbi:MAG: undecaprenyl-phosphate glucose phosphotransferase [Vulcanimicrobiaceae bacterium]
MTTHQGTLETSLGPALPGLRPRPLPARYSAQWGLLLLVGDVSVVVLSFFASQMLTHHLIADLLARDGAVQWLIFSVLLWLMLFERIGMYQRTFSSNARDEVYASLAASVMAMTPSVLLFLSLPSLQPSKHLLVVAAILAACGVSFARYVVHSFRTRMFPARARRIAVVGTPERVAAIPSDLSLTNEDDVLRLPVDGFDDDVAMVVAAGDVSRFEWLQIAVERGYQELIVTEALPPEIMPALLRFTESKGVRLAFAPMRIRPHACDFVVRRDGGLALLYPQSLAICTSGAESIRRVFDLAIALPALLLLSPILLGIALVVRLDSGNPVFYRQIRVGRHNREFEIIKFRTMRPDAESASGPVWARSGEDRTTRIGKFLRRSSLDELPQLFNVLRGEMSIVGPRPERPYYVEQFRKMLPRYDERHLVRPGITGWSHVHMRRNVDTTQIGERLSYDLFYLEHWSVFMDILIICKTGAEFLFHSAV